MGILGHLPPVMHLRDARVASSMNSEHNFCQSGTIILTRVSPTLLKWCRTGLQHPPLTRDARLAGANRAAG
eukprot:scaffold63053_cov14-Tisochrysis_lutea.AAC.1